SSSTWDSIFSGSSAFVMRSLMLDLISVPSLEKTPMASTERTGSKVWLQRSLRACYSRCFAGPHDRRNTMSTEPRNLPRPGGIIMDGNGRWAERRGLPRIDGHRVGADSVRDVTRAARELGIEALTLYAFSSQNWQRPVDEVAGLMQLLRDYLIGERAEILDNAIRLDAIGDVERLPAMVKEPLDELRAASAANHGMTLTLALSYGGRESIARAV